MILIVDDNQENIFSLKTLLELHKFTVDTASSGEEALKCVLKNSYSLIILDVQMPEMDGFEVAEAISGYSKSSEIPIIFLSAINIHKKYITRGYGSGGVDYVTKPFDADILLLKVKTFYRLSEQKRRLVAMDKSLREEIEFRKKAENDLEQKVEELKSTLESMPQMAFTTCQDGTLEYVNNHWGEYSASASLFPESDETSVADYLQLAIGQRKQFIQEIKIKPLNSVDMRFHVLYLTPVFKGDDIVRWVGIFTDIHEQKMASHILEQKVEERTRELIDANQKLEASNAELNKFAFIASHDLQEPLRKIQIFSDIVERKIESDTAGAMEFIKKIIASAERMRNLITSLLAYSKKPETNFYEMVDVNAILEEVLKDFEIKITEKNARIDIDRFPALQAIPSQIQQMFYNLIGNSLKFSRESVAPHIVIKAELIDSKETDAAVSSAGDFCRITFSDNGIGFNQAYAHKIFEIFQRLNSNHYEGTGIGLAIVKKVIDRHDGVVSVIGKEGEGATFIIVIPVTQN